MSNSAATQAGQIKHNDWSPLEPPAPGAWTPRLPVTVVVAGEPDQTRLDLTLASLRHQDYPADLMDVVVVDSGPGPTLTLPKIAPARCQLLAGSAGSFGAATAAGAGEVVVRVETGLVATPGLVTALARWQHASADAVSVGVPLHVDTVAVTADEVADRCADDTLDRAFPSAARPHPRLSRLLDRTHQLRTADHLAFLAVDGAPFAFHRSRYQEPGTDPHQGDDVEVGYRLAQAGAVFVPEPGARAWVQPAPDEQAVTGEHATSAWRRTALADLMPYPRVNRAARGRVWGVPLVTAVVPATGPYDLVRAAVDRLLAGDETDLRVLLVGDWHTGSADPELELLAAEYRSEPRVRLTGSAPATAFPSPYLLRVPARLGVGPGTVRALVAAAERWRAGLIRVLPAGAAAATNAVELWSTAALSRAARSGAGTDPLPAVAESFGQRWETGSEYDVIDLTAVPAEQLNPAPAAKQPAKPAKRQETVAVGGARSLAKAAAFVTRRYAKAAKRKLVRR